MYRTTKSLIYDMIMASFPLCASHLYLYLNLLHKLSDEITINTHVPCPRSLVYDDHTTKTTAAYKSNIHSNLIYLIFSLLVNPSFVCLNVCCNPAFLATTSNKGYIYIFTFSVHDSITEFRCHTKNTLQYASLALQLLHVDLRMTVITILY